MGRGMVRSPSPVGGIPMIDPGLFAIAAIGGAALLIVVFVATLIDTLIHLGDLW